MAQRVSLRCWFPTIPIAYGSARIVLLLWLSSAQSENGEVVAKVPASVGEHGF